jgi:hypothetical protein
VLVVGGGRRVFLIRPAKLGKPTKLQIGDRAVITTQYLLHPASFYEAGQLGAKEGYNVRGSLALRQREALGYRGHVSLTLQ